MGKQYLSATNPKDLCQTSVEISADSTTTMEVTMTAVTVPADMMEATMAMIKDMMMVVITPMTVGLAMQTMSKSGALTVDTGLMSEFTAVQIFTATTAMEVTSTSTALGYTHGFTWETQ